MAGVHQIWAMDLGTGTIRVFAGTSREGIDDGNRLTAATLAQPSGITTDGKNLYWVDPESSSVREIAVDGSGDVQTIVGTGLFDYGDKDGQGKSAKLQHPQGIALAGNTLYVADTYNHQLRTVDLVSHNVATAAGTGQRGWADGPGADAMFDEPGGLSYANGKIYLADTNNGLIRVLDVATHAVSTLTLSNLSVATSATPGNVVKQSIDAQTVAPSATTLRLTVTAPAGYHLNSLAPSALSLAASDASVLQLGQTTLQWSTDERKRVTRRAHHTPSGFEHAHGYRPGLLLPDRRGGALLHRTNSAHRAHHSRGRWRRRSRRGLHPAGRQQLTGPRRALTALTSHR